MQEEQETTSAPENPFGSPRERLAAHEAAHAVVGTLLFGKGFVRRVCLRWEERGYAVTETTGIIAVPFAWNGQDLEAVPDAMQRVESTLLRAAAMQLMAGMAAEAMIFGCFKPASDDLDQLGGISESCGYSRLDSDDPDLQTKLFEILPYSDGLANAVALLRSRRPQFDPVMDRLKQTDTLQGLEVEALMDGQQIRD